MMIDENGKETEITSKGNVVKVPVSLPLYGSVALCVTK